MYLERISLNNFKSYEADSFRFSHAVNCIVGENGSGKTNLLDAIYFLALTKSAFSNQDGLSIHHEGDFMMIDGVFVKGEDKIAETVNADAAVVFQEKEPSYQIEHWAEVTHLPKKEQITVSIQRGLRKAVLHDKKPYERLTEHIGKFPVVLMAPNDTDLIREGSEERRKFFDGVLSQLNPEYLADLQLYNRLLDQRNGLLRQFAERNYLDDDLLEVYTEPLLELTFKLHQQRRQFSTQFLPVFQRHYANLSESRESVEVIYESEVASPDFRREFWMNRQRDVAAQRTTKGAHKDDYVFEINGFGVKKFGSQGQQKSFVIALKLAQFELLAQEKAVKPLLLLDDIFDKLDDRRIQKLIGMMTDGTFGQIFVTDARPERTQQLLEGLNTEVRFFRTKP
ncbi:MAG: DNA replication and repair protein RecF [Spirosomataceae bacterium]